MRTARDFRNGLPSDCICARHGRHRNKSYIPQGNESVSRTGEPLLKADICFFEHLLRYSTLIAELLAPAGVILLWPFKLGDKLLHRRELVPVARSQVVLARFGCRLLAPRGMGGVFESAESDFPLVVIATLLRPQVLQCLLMNQVKSFGGAVLP
jgi:hypothetical protein